MRIALCLVCMFALAPALSHAGVVGQYSVDKKRMLQEMQATIEKLPKRRRAFARMAKAMLQSMKLDMTLAPRGKASVLMFMKVFGKSKTKRGEGTWQTAKNKQGGSFIRIETKSTDEKGKAQIDKLECDVQQDGGLVCANVNKSGKKKKSFYFNKVTPKKK